MEFTKKHVEYACRYWQSRNPYQDSVFFRVAIAVEVLRVIVGNEWVNQAIFPNNHPVTTPSVKAAKQFFRSKEGGYQYQERVYRLASRLYELQDVLNLSRVISDLTKRNFEGAFAEIEAGYHLKSRGIPFMYILPQGQKGSDFDLQIQEGGAKINCEVKHKIEATVISKQTVEGSFSDAKSQLPEDEPAILFVKVPAGWFGSVEVDRALGAFLPRSPNVVGIMFRWEEISKNHEGTFFGKYKFVANEAFTDESGRTTNLIGRLILNPGNPPALDELLTKYIKTAS